jgi:cytochrome c oxidase subunit 1
LGATYYWFPKFSGRMLSEKLGQWHFAFAFIGFNIAFFPMHLLGLAGMPRRIYTYPRNDVWASLNLLATVGAFVFLFSFLVFAWNVITSLRSGKAATDNPWDAPGLEWATTSPPPPHNFDRIPVVTSREPLWQERESLPVLSGLGVDERELLLTTTTEALADLREASPSPSIWPLLTAIITTGFFISSIFTQWAVVWFLVPLTVALTAWFWPKMMVDDK